MFELRIPGWKELAIAFIVFDVNGTICVDGELVDEVAHLTELLRSAYGLDFYLVTAASRGIPEKAVAALDAHLEVVPAGEETQKKCDLVRRLGPERVAAIGNGANDAAMLAEAALGIAVIQAEGAAKPALEAADIVVPRIEDALRLFLQPERLLATLRR